MNKVITDGLVLMPPKFEDGLTVWSSGDGTAGSPTYDGDANAAIVSADQDFGGCLELLKTVSAQKLRWTAQTPIIPGCYLRVRARIKAISGALPDVRIAGWALGAGDLHVEGLIEAATPVSISAYGDVVEVSAIVGTSGRTGVDLPWGTEPIYGHFGLDLTGPNGGIVRIDDIVIEDISSAFLRDLIATVDVRDYGAIGDGVTDNSSAFALADADANGRRVLVPDGVYFLGDHVTLQNPALFQGTVTMPDDKRLSLRRNFDFPTYVTAFGDEVVAFKKAVQVLFNFNDHESLDLGGRQISLDAPIDLHAEVANKTTFNLRRVIRNGELRASVSSNWDDDVTTSQATYSAANKLQLTGVVNAANVPIGARVDGNGVGREVYVKEVNIGAQTVTLNLPLYNAVGTQTFTFTRHKYLIDMSGFGHLSRLNFDNIEFNCAGQCSAVLLPPSGLILQFRDCYFTAPKDRAVTSIGTGCQGMLIDQCQFISNEQPARAQDRSSIGLNVNANDVKLRDNRANRFAHFAVLHGGGHILTGNHFFGGDNVADGIRQAGIVLTRTNLKSTVVGNYIDNSFIEWTNEHDSDPDFASEFSFGGLTITGNVFTASDVATSFNWIVVKPHGAGHFIDGLTVTGNAFKTINGNIDRAEKVDTSLYPLDFGRMRKIMWDGNTYTAVNAHTTNPIMISHEEASDMKTWSVDLSQYLPFQGWVRRVESVVADGKIITGSGAQVVDMPYVNTRKGAGQNQIEVIWQSPCRGEVWVTARVDNPT